MRERPGQQQVISSLLPGLSSRLVGPALITAFWSVAALESIVWRFYMTQQTRRPVALDFIVVAEILMFGIAATLTPVIAALARRFPLNSGRWWVHLGAGVLFALTTKFLWDFAMLIQYPTPWIVRQFSWTALRQSLIAGIQFNVLLYWVMVMGITAYDHVRRYQSSLVEAAELRARLAETQLESLRIQLDPHFLFNTLHSIAAMVHSDPDGADLMISNLSELLRRSLDQRGRQQIPLREELDFLHTYLNIQGRRFGSRLTVRFDVQEEDALVPCMILQPLVENAIRHAIAKRRTGGTLIIRTKAQGDVLWLEVEDGGGSAPRTPFEDGIGLRNTRSRLAQLYCDKSRFLLEPGEGGTRARLTIPLQREAVLAGHTR